MKVKELTDILYDFNPNAEIVVVKNGMSHDFELSFGSADGVIPETATVVCLHIDTDDDFDRCG